MDSYKLDNIKSYRGKLRVCLAGKGFRASLFHLGMLRRMEELANRSIINNVNQFMVLCFCR